MDAGFVARACGPSVWWCARENSRADGSPEDQVAHEASQDGFSSVEDEVDLGVEAGQAGREVGQEVSRHTGVMRNVDTTGASMDAGPEPSR